MHVIARVSGAGLVPFIAVKVQAYGAFCLATHKPTLSRPVRADAATPGAVFAPHKMHSYLGFTSRRSDG